MKGASGLRPKGQMSIVEAMKMKCGKVGVKKEESSEERKLGGTSLYDELLEYHYREQQQQQKQSSFFAPGDTPDEQTSLDFFDAPPPSAQQPSDPLDPLDDDEHSNEPKPPQIFAGTTIYINGSTHPIISDHRLKQLLVSHGARLSIALGRRTVTHVILGRTNADGGCGGGLAGGKLQKEIVTVRGKGVRFVGVEWVVDSLKAGKRLPEARFRVMEMAGERQRSVYNMLTGL